jgi:hypothetical protein
VVRAVGQPSQVRLRPVGPWTREAHLVAQQKLDQAVASSHQIAAQILARPDQVTQRFLLNRGDDHTVKLTGHQQPHQPLRVSPIGLDTIHGAAWNEPRRANHA